MGKITRKRFRDHHSETAMQSGSLVIDRDSCTVHNIKILGWESTNARKYQPDAVKRDQAKYLNAKANVDHLRESDPFTPYQSRFGRITRVEWREDGLFGDLRYNPKHAQTESFLWWCEYDPSAVGFSHSAILAGYEQDGLTYIDEIVEVYSVDLVADPATTHGVFEAMDPTQTPPNDPSKSDKADDLDPTSSDYATHLGSAITAIMQDDSLDAASKRKKILGILKLLEDDETPTEDPTKSESEDGEDGDDKSKKELGEAVAKKLIETSGIPAALVTPTFTKSVAKCRKLTEALELVSDRKAVTAYKAPTSLPGGNGKTTPSTEAVKLDAASIANTLRG